MKREATAGDLPDALHDLCLQLFDIWCEKRSVIPLAYLMHAWPTSNPDAQARGRLLCALRDLQMWHAEALSKEEHQMIGRLLTLSA